MPALIKEPSDGFPYGGVTKQTELEETLPSPGANAAQNLLVLTGQQ